jgi:hypothetical protein
VRANSCCVYLTCIQIQKAISESYAEFMAGRSYVYNVARQLDLTVRSAELLLVSSLWRRLY